MWRTQDAGMTVALVLDPHAVLREFAPLHAIVGYDAEACWMLWYGYTRYLTQLCTVYGPDPIANLSNRFMDALTSTHLHGMLPPDITAHCYQTLTQELWNVIDPIFALMEDHNQAIEHVAGYWTQPVNVPTPPTLIFCGDDTLFTKRTDHENTDHTRRLGLWGS